MKNKGLVLQINSSNHGSTGHIMLNLSRVAERHDYKSLVSYPASRSNRSKIVDNSIEIGTIVERNLHIKLAYLTGWNGKFSKCATKKFLKSVKKINPDIIHLHNLHNCYINLEMLFEVIKAKNIPVVWTLHDCWAFTGQCPYYSMVSCDKWTEECYECPQYRMYPESLVDKTREMFNLKKNWFTGVENLTIVTPSKWLKEQVKRSFLKDYSTKVIYNGIDLNLFKPIKSDFREKFSIQDKKVILGVANPWSKRKGLDLIVELSKILDESYQIVLVGLSKKQIETLPKNIIGLERTSNQQELIKIYSTSDFFINPSVEETLGMVTIEAMACGTPVIVSNYTAVPESVDEKCGVVVNEYSVDGFYNGIKAVENMRISQEALLEHAANFDGIIKYKEYIEVYNNILRKSNHFDYEKN